MNIADTYPVFEPDQVLTNKHLNSLFDYLNQQDRLTRMKLIGSGIVCGLDITWKENISISISAGCGLTSQGFLITFCDTVFSHYINYNTPDFPDDLHFITQCPEKEIAKIPFYKNEFTDGIFQLITESDFEKLDAGEKAAAVSLTQASTNVLEKYAVVLFLEAEEERLKNCDTNDCNDKGSLMDFDVKALLVEKGILDQILKQHEADVPAGNPSVDPVLSDVHLRRYNVPVQDLKSADDVLQAFVNLVDDAKLKSIAEVLNYCYIHYYYLLKDEPTNPFAMVFEQFKELREEILKNDPILIQYFYDFIDDVLKAYDEFRHRVFDVNSSCCGGELRFPLHLMLGAATENTSSLSPANYRQYFIYSPLFNAQREKLADVRLLFTRMRLMVTETAFQAIRDFEKLAVKITPSRYGHAPLSKRCIPFYYNAIDAGKELYRYWSYEKTRRGRERFNLSYNAPLFSTIETVVHPLLYDIERFDFFRIEGHIGKNITAAITTVKTIQQQNNLPFDTIALSADFIGALVKGEEPQCVIQDLESDYRVLIAEFICKMHDAFCFVARLPYTIPVRILNFNAVSLANATKEDAAAIKTTLSFNPAVLEKLNHPFASNLVNEFQAVKKYVKGNTLLKLCNPAANTIGAAYIQMQGNFSNPVAVNTDQPVTLVQFHAFEFIDAVESILELVMNNELSEITITDLKNRSDRFEKEVRLLSGYAILFLQNLKNSDKTHLADLAVDLYLDLLIYNLEMLLHLCFVEQVEALKSEYLRRVAQYRLAKNFGYYFKNHGGIEHKAGVPRAGTFILVYHEERKNRLIDKNSLFVNKELGNLMLTHFREILEPDVPLDTLTYKTKLLQTAILYKDPELYGRFKDILQKYLDECQDLPNDTRIDLTELINNPPARHHFELTDGMVIADFYIPYMCCSDCSPVAYILPDKPPEPTEDPTIKIDKNSFCSDDKNTYPIIATPKNGIVSGPGISIQNDGAYVFVPAAAGVGLHTLSCTFNSKIAAVQVEVIATPIPRFSFTTSMPDGRVFVKFTNESSGTNNQTTYNWSNNGFTFSEKEHPDDLIFYLPQLPQTVILKEANGGCPAEFSAEIRIDVENRNLNVCANLETLPLEPNLGPSDVVTIISNDGLKLSDSGLLARPAATQVTETTTFHVSYSVNNRQVNANITLIRPDADFTIRITQNSLGNTNIISLSLESKNKTYTTNQWKIQPTQITAPLTQDPLQNFTLTLVQIREAGKISIQHTVTVATDSGNCASTAPYELLFTNLDKALDKVEFDNQFQF